VRGEPALKERQTKASPAKIGTPKFGCPFRASPIWTNYPGLTSSAPLGAQIVNAIELKTENGKRKTDNLAPKGRRFFSFLLPVFSYDTPAWQ